MKKLTAGIFATLLAVVSVGAAHAEIASKGYVDQQVGTKADARLEPRQMQQLYHHYRVLFLVIHHKLAQ